MNDRLNFDHYCVLRRNDGAPWELGRGAKGITYKAQDVNLLCIVALKVVDCASFPNEDEREQFVNEARAAALLRHPNIASVFHLGRDEQHFFAAMEFVDGETVEAAVRRQGRLSTSAALRIAVHVAKALAEAEKHALVHRDIKPSNIMLERGVESRRAVKVIDFGLVQSTGSIAGGTSFSGTPHYCSPEQIQAQELDMRSDIYALGCTLFFMLTSTPPFEGPLASIFAQHLESPPCLEKLSLEPPEVRRLISKMLQKDPAARHPNASALLADLEHCARQAGPPLSGILSPKTSFERAPRSSMSSRRLILASTGLVALAATFIFSPPGHQPRSESPETAVRSRSLNSAVEFSPDAMIHAGALPEELQFVSLDGSTVNVLEYDDSRNTNSGSRRADALSKDSTLWDGVSAEPVQNFALGDSEPEFALGDDSIVYETKLVTWKQPPATTSLAEKPKATKSGTPRLHRSETTAFDRFVSDVRSKIRRLVGRR